ncbi:MAG: recombinase zinc beta ribbon domain-containing protein, partial [Ktedonobacteraceae bacterium]|nr:recombinase zinc beta ribbon domain-containing protein [Ktedonobacteraceae bacterium]
MGCYATWLIIRSNSAFEYERVLGYGELVWRRPNRATLQMMLKHPLYAGAYVYGRRQEDPRRKQPERPRTGRMVMPEEHWLVHLSNCCPASIAPEHYERNQARLQANRSRADAMGAARRGAALLAGLVVCARCECRMTVHDDNGGASLHTYECVERHHHYGEPRCQHLAGPCLDRYVCRQ